MSILKNITNSRYLNTILCDMKRSRKARNTPQCNDENNTVTENKDDSSSTLIDIFQKKRSSIANDAHGFSFQKKRVRVLTTQTEVPEGCHGPVIYWMWRDIRVQDNWAFLYAQRLAFKFKLPLIVCFCLPLRCLNATLRHYKFMLNGLQEVEQECGKLQIGFQILQGPVPSNLINFIHKHQAALVVCDFSPLRLPLDWLENVRNQLNGIQTVPLVQVDAHNIVPVWVASDKQEYAARTIRPKITEKIQDYLTEFPPIVQHKYTTKIRLPATNWKDVYESLECDTTISEVVHINGGYKSACWRLETFCNTGLRDYYKNRNDPTINALSGLSPWFHFGHISVQRCILHIKQYDKQYKQSVETFCEEAIIRRELSDNFCFYNKNYDRFDGLPEWSRKTLTDHIKDKRSPCYNIEEFEQARTHDDLWNSAQLQLVKEGKMHGYLRMYWAKKILEWSQTPEKALCVAIQLNDKYSLDGLDPNGYVGCMWSIGGLHDQSWAERSIYGKVRYMNYQGCKRKFNVSNFVEKYGGKTYDQEKQKRKI